MARHGQIPAARTCYGDLGNTIVIRLDASIVIAHSDTTGAKGTFKGTYGHHPLLATCDNTGELLVVLLREGNAGSNTGATTSKCWMPRSPRSRPTTAETCWSPSTAPEPATRSSITSPP